MRGRRKHLRPARNLRICPSHPTSVTPELIVLDLDGTLLDSRGRISPRNAAAMAAAESAGIAVVVATGRSWSESKHVLGPLGYQRPFVGAGGAVLAAGLCGTTMLRHSMPSDLVGQAATSLLAHGHAVLLLKDSIHEGDEYVVIGDRPLDPASEWWFRTFGIRHRRVTDIGEDPHPEDTVRIGVVATGRELAVVAEELRRDLGSQLFLQNWSAVTSSAATGSTTHLLEIFDPKVNKWSMVQELCRREGIDRSRVVAIGDGLNDVEMLRGAAIGIAMANAGPEALAAAASITGHHDEDGVAEAIERYL